MDQNSKFSLGNTLRSREEDTSLIDSGMALAGEQNQKRIPESPWHRVLRPVSYLSFLCLMTLNRMEPWNTSHAKFQYLVCVASQNDVSQRSQAICHVEIIYIEQNYVQNICLYSPSKYALALYRRSMRPKCPAPNRRTKKAGGRR